MAEKPQKDIKKKENNYSKSFDNKAVKEPRRFHGENYSFKKRPSSKPFDRPNDIYITNKSNFKAQLQKCESILSDSTDDVFLHCTGNAITRGINLALTLQKDSNNSYAYEVNTSTIEFLDDFHPLKDYDDFAIQKRLNSCVHIRLYRKSNLLINTNQSNTSATTTKSN